MGFTFFVLFFDIFFKGTYIVICLGFLKKLMVINIGYKNRGQSLLIRGIPFSEERIEAHV